ncbi:MAG: helix-turn-helix domain-containing protein [bacterium]|nr:helix-turn-helix domain-containing protein [bacterium]
MNEIEETLGQYLKRERDFRGIALEDVFKRTRIAPRILRAIEMDDFEAIPGTVFIKGYLRAYSQFIGLNADEVVLRYDALLRRGGVVVKEGNFQKFAGVQPKGRFFLLLSVLGVILLIAVYLSAR